MERERKGIFLISKRWFLNSIRCSTKVVLGTKGPSYLRDRVGVTLPKDFQWRSGEQMFHYHVIQRMKHE